MQIECGLRDEYSTLVSVLLHRPGEELLASADPPAVCMLEPLDVHTARQQHDALATAYQEAGVKVQYLRPQSVPPPNTMYLADLFFMTPEGAILARPAMPVRLGEERLAAEELAALGVPLLGAVEREGTFEGADALWIAPKRVLLGRGRRTNPEGASQVGSFLGKTGVEVVEVDLPVEVMHLMGVLRFLDMDLAVGWSGRLPEKAVEAVEQCGFEMLFPPDEEELIKMAINLVTLGPRRILMPAGCPRTQGLFEEAGVECRTVAVDELVKGAGGIGCLTGVLHRRQVKDISVQ
jgi:N-dimethylarginine dimethylaminohydrolase